MRLVAKNGNGNTQRWQCQWHGQGQRTIVADDGGENRHPAQHRHDVLQGEHPLHGVVDVGGDAMLVRAQVQLGDRVVHALSL